jgi:hypothetical protein
LGPHARNLGEVELYRSFLLSSIILTLEEKFWTG